ncbi:MAG: hypothetical protein U0271_36835 [Polyangiaceae bacterium]
MLRATRAADATVVPTSGNEIVISGKAAGGAPGYHPADSAWEETPAKDWGLGFQSKLYGEVLVISTQNEIAFIHHHYAIEGLTVELPAGVVLVRETRPPSGEGGADLTPPKPTASAR